MEKAWRRMKDKKEAKQHKCDEEERSCERRWANDDTTSTHSFSAHQHECDAVRVMQTFKVKIWLKKYTFWHQVWCSVLQTPSVHSWHLSLWMYRVKVDSYLRCPYHHSAIIISISKSGNHTKECWGKQKSGNADSLSRKKGERVSNSGSGEEREGVTVCSAAVTRGVKDGKREEWEVRSENCISERKEDEKRGSL